MSAALGPRPLTVNVWGNNSTALPYKARPVTGLQTVVQSAGYAPPDVQAIAVKIVPTVFVAAP